MAIVWIAQSILINKRMGKTVKLLNVILIRLC